MTMQTSPSSGDPGQQSEVAAELKNDAARLKDTMGARAKQEAESRKGQAVQVAGSASTALNTAADDLRANPDVPDWMATALQQAARKIEGLASHVDGRNIDELGQEVAEFGRRSPGAFLAASAAAGFAAARVLRAGADKKRHDRNDQQGGQYSQTYGAGGQGYSGGQGYASTDQDNGQDWAADENIMPTQEGGFEPAYGDDAAGKGGTQI